MPKEALCSVSEKVHFLWLFYVTNIYGKLRFEHLEQDLSAIFHLNIIGLPCTTGSVVAVELKESILI